MRSSFLRNTLVFSSIFFNRKGCIWDITVVNKHCQHTHNYLVDRKKEEDMNENKGDLPSGNLKESYLKNSFRSISL